MRRKLKALRLVSLSNSHVISQWEAPNLEGWPTVYHSG
jgi:hypothetical protein